MTDDTAPSTGRIGIRQVAELAGVGIASVSRVLSGQPGSSPKLTKRVLEAARQLGYTPNVLAQGLRRRSTRSVGFVCSDITNPLLASIVRGAENTLSAAGYSVLLTNSGGDPATDAQRIELLQQRQVDGLILLPASEQDPATLNALKRIAVPLVVIDREIPSISQINYVLSDHYNGVGAATRYLLSKGHRCIGIVVATEVRPSRERLRAAKDAYVALGLEPNLIVDKGPLSSAHGQAALDSMLASSQPPTAVLLGGNQLLEGALRAIDRHGLRVGRDFSLVCCDDLPLSRLYDPPIDTVHRDTAQIGKSAAELILRQLAMPEQAATVILPTWFEARGSTVQLNDS